MLGIEETAGSMQGIISQYQATYTDTTGQPCSLAEEASNMLGELGSMATNMIQGVMNTILNPLSCVANNLGGDVASKYNNVQQNLMASASNYTSGAVLQNAQTQLTSAIEKEGCSGFSALNAILSDIQQGINDVLSAAQTINSLLSDVGQTISQALSILQCLPGPVCNGLVNAVSSYDSNFSNFLNNMNNVKTLTNPTEQLSQTMNNVNQKLNVSGQLDTILSSFKNPIPSIQSC